MIAKFSNIFKTLTSKGFTFYDNDNYYWNFFKKFSLLSILKFSINTNGAAYGEQDFIKDLKKSNLDEWWIQYIVDSRRFHKWHLVSPSPWPFFSSISALILVLGFVLWMYKVPSSLGFYLPSLLTSGFFLILFTMFLWFRDIIREGFLGYHTSSVLKNLRMGFILFIVSEIMFFFSFFWAYFHFSIDPSIWGGDVWPPDGIVYFWLCENVVFADVKGSMAGALSPTFYEYSFFEMPNNIFYNPTSDFQNWTLFLRSENSLLGFDRFYSPLFHLAKLSYEEGNGYKRADDYTRHLETIAQDRLTSLKMIYSITPFISFNMPEFDSEEFWFIEYYPPAAHFVEQSDEDTLEFLDLFSKISDDEFIENFNESLVSYHSYFSSFKDSYLKSYNNNITTPPHFNNLFDLFYPVNIHFNLYDRGLLINPFKIPLLNTCILLTSGAWLTISHIKLKRGEFLESLIFLFITLIFAILFIVLQFSEYVKSGFGINDTVYGGIFYLLTGFHGFHVIIGTIFLAICLVRMHLMHFSPSNHFGFEAAIWYWHFVDVVWVFLYIFVYLWPGFYFYVNHVDYSYDESINSSRDLSSQCDSIVLGLNIDYLLSEFPNSAFNYHRAFSAETKRKIISQMSNTSLAFETFKKLRGEMPFKFNNGVECTRTDILYNHVATSMFDTFSSLSRLENTSNATIYWHNIFNFSNNYYDFVAGGVADPFNTFYKYGSNLNGMRFYNFELLFKDKLSCLKLTAEDLYNTTDFYINYNKYLLTEDAINNSY